MLVGVDIGGTFTDLVASVDGRLQIHKLPSTPHDPALAMLDGLAALSPQGLAAVERVSHGSTVATNAILERKGARAALLVTQGFRDLLAIGRQERPQLYALQPQLPPPLIPRRWCYEVAERLDPTGAVRVPLDVAALDRVLDDVAAQGIESLAVCFLYSYVNPTHEQAVRARILERGLLTEEQIALSCEVLPEFREFERASTVALEAYVRPVMGRYLGHLEEALDEDVPVGATFRGRPAPDADGTGTEARPYGVGDDRGRHDADGAGTDGAGTEARPYAAGDVGATLRGRPDAAVGDRGRPLRVMKSDGGVMSARRARQQAIHTALSGPAAGVIGAFHLAQRAGFDHVITLDMGGTSTDVALCPGEPVRRAESEIAHLPLRTRLLDIETIGAGGGSIARLDAGGALQVGPQSAGADPGPVAYGRGGQQVTVTDADLVLGRLDPRHFLGGRMALDAAAARSALAALGAAMGCSAEAAAQGVVHVANVNIDRAVRRVSVARGYDPRDFTLVAFGGAGPLHACEVARRLEIPRVLVPRYPGVLCALGLLMADVVLERSRSVLRPVNPETVARLRALADEMAAQARADLRQEGFAEGAMRFVALVDARYQGQSYERTIPFAADLAAAFHAEHARAYGHALPERTVEVVNLRLQATGLVEKPTLVAEAERPGAAPANGVLGDLALYDRERLHPGATFAGPALVLQMDSTTFIPAGWSARVDGYRNLVLESIGRAVCS